MLKDAFEVVTLLADEREPVVSYASTWNGKPYFHIRKLYNADGEWKPGKGLSVPYSRKDDLLAALGALTAA